MPRPFSKNKTVRHRLEDRLDELAGQTDELRQQVAERAPVVRDQLVDMLPDKAQLLDLRDDLFERLPDNVTDKLPEKVKPKRSRFKRIAILGVVTGAGAAAFAVLKNRGQTPPPPAPVPPAPTSAPSPAAATAPATDASAAPEKAPGA